MELAGSIEDITATLPDSAEILEPIGIYRPDVGDLCLYAPWGNLSIFYQDFRYSESLIMLGHVDSGMDIVSSMEENTAVVLEKLN